MTPGKSPGGIVIDDLGRQKNQNALKTGGGPREKKKNKSRKRNKIVRMFVLSGVALFCRAPSSGQALRLAFAHGAARGLTPLGQRFC